MSEKKAAEKVDPKNPASAAAPRRLTTMGHKVKLIKIADDPTTHSMGGNVKKVLFSTYADDGSGAEGHGFFYLNPVPSGGTTATSNPNLERLIVAYANGSIVSYNLSPNVYFTRVHGENFYNQAPPIGVIPAPTETQHFLLRGNIT